MDSIKTVIPLHESLIRARPTADYLREQQAPRTLSLNPIKSLINNVVQPSFASPTAHEPTASPVASTSAIPEPVKKPRRKWSERETLMLVEGCNRHGVGSWKAILGDPLLYFDERAPVDLKDRFRTHFPDAYRHHYPNAKHNRSVTRTKRLSVPVPTQIKTATASDSELNIKSLDFHRSTSLPSSMRSSISTTSVITGGGSSSKRPRRAFTAEEDKALKEGYDSLGTVWGAICKLPVFDGHRSSLDLRDRFRNAFPDLYEREGYKPRAKIIKARKVRSSSGSGPVLNPVAPFHDLTMTSSKNTSAPLQRTMSASSLSINKHNPLIRSNSVNLQASSQVIGATQSSISNASDLFAWDLEASALDLRSEDNSNSHLFDSAFSLSPSAWTIPTINEASQSSITQSKTAPTSPHASTQLGLPHAQSLPFNSLPSDGLEANFFDWRDFNPVSESASTVVSSRQSVESDSMYDGEGSTWESLSYSNRDRFQSASVGDVDEALHSHFKLDMLSASAYDRYDLPMLAARASNSRDFASDAGVKDGHHNSHSLSSFMRFGLGQHHSLAGDLFRTTAMSSPNHHMNNTLGMNQSEMFTDAFKPGSSYALKESSSPMGMSSLGEDSAESSWQGFNLTGTSLPPQDFSLRGTTGFRDQNVASPLTLDPSLIYSSDVGLNLAASLSSFQQPGLAFDPADALSSLKSQITRHKHSEQGIQPADPGGGYSVSAPGITSAAKRELTPLVFEEKKVEQDKRPMPTLQPQSILSPTLQSTSNNYSIHPDSPSSTWLDLAMPSTPKPHSSQLHDTSLKFSAGDLAKAGEWRLPPAFRIEEV